MELNNKSVQPLSFLGSRPEHSRSLLESLVDSSEDAIISKDLNGIITSWNAAAERIFGFTAAEIIGKSILALIPPELQDEERGIMVRLRQGQRIQRYETVRLAADGRRVEVSLTISPIKDRSGRIIGASKIAHDIAERKSMERLLVQSEKFAATGRMAATIAHEINNTLESVFNLIYLIRQNPQIPADVQEYLATAERELARISHIAKQTLGYYRDFDSATSLQLNGLLDEVLAFYQSRIQNAKVRVECDYAASLPAITLNRGEMVQVFSNLIINSIYAMAEGGDLRITTRAAALNQADGIEVLIADDGCGIPPQNLLRVFDPFFTTRTNMGTGIGLWVVKKFIEARGGNIAVLSSTRTGEHGTTFTIFLPFVETQVPPARAAMLLL
jgi:PAS domain S-box-containing protein